MNERKTISDSKRAFHHAFPYVIPPLYRRLADELLVELHLLSRQKAFKTNLLFAVGLCQVFDSFTRGYKPINHLHNLFEALCKSNGFEPIQLRNQSEGALAIVREHSIEDVKHWLMKKGEGAPSALAGDIKALSDSGLHYSRLMPIGILNILSSAKVKDSFDLKIIEEFAVKISCEIGYSSIRVEKDLNLYKASQEKLDQAIELMNETLESERRKREKYINTESAEDKKISPNSEISEGTVKAS